MRHNQPTDPASPPPAPSGRSPLAATLSLTWMNNCGAAAALVGVYFVARNAYEFTQTQSLLLGIVQGIPYIIAAAFAGPVMRRLAGPGRALSTRGLLALMQVGLALLCLLPMAWKSPLAIWTMVALYSPLTGLLWPTIESFLSSQRSGEELRKATGRFNLAWSSSQAVTLWAIAPFMEESPLLSIAAMGLTHIACLPLILFIKPEPGAHASEDHHLADPVLERRFRDLLWCHQVVLVLAYVVYTALNPLLPAITESLGVSKRSQTLLVSTWTISRMFSFLFMERWGGWHGKAITLLWSTSLLLAGFVVCMLAPSPTILVLGLALFGAGMGTTYSAAFYYAMEVGSAGIDAGGKHEALIGVGYAVGPSTGLLAGAGAGLGLYAAGAVSLVTVGLVLVPTAAVALAVTRRLRRSTRA